MTGSSSASASCFWKRPSVIPSVYLTWPWKDPPFLIGKPSISMGHLYHGYVSHNQRVHIQWFSDGTVAQEIDSRSGDFRNNPNSPPSLSFGEQCSSWVFHCHFHLVNNVHLGSSKSHVGDLAVLQKPKHLKTKLCPCRLDSAPGPPGSGWSGFRPPRRSSEVLGCFGHYPLVNFHIFLWKITMFNGKIHYFNGHFQ